jgi:hypothetical protein
MIGSWSRLFMKIRLDSWSLPQIIHADEVKRHTRGLEVGDLLRLSKEASSK